MICLIIFAIGLLAVSLWGHYCNEKTNTQRGELEDIIHSARVANVLQQGKDFYVVEWQELESVSYYQHFWYLFTFRNPYNAYSKKLRELINEY